MEILRLQIVLRVCPEIVLRLRERIKVGFPGHTTSLLPLASPNLSVTETILKNVWNSG